MAASRRLGTDRHRQFDRARRAGDAGLGVGRAVPATRRGHGVDPVPESVSCPPRSQVAGIDGAPADPIGCLPAMPAGRPTQTVVRAAQSRRSPRTARRWPASAGRCPRCPAPRRRRCRQIAPARIQKIGVRSAREPARHQPPLRRAAAIAAGTPSSRPPSASDLQILVVRVVEEEQPRALLIDEHRALKRAGADAGRARSPSPCARCRARSRGRPHSPSSVVSLQPQRERAAGWRTPTPATTIAASPAIIQTTPRAAADPLARQRDERDQADAGAENAGARHRRQQAAGHQDRRRREPELHRVDRSPGTGWPPRPPLRLIARHRVADRRAAPPSPASSPGRCG